MNGELERFLHAWRDERAREDRMVEDIVASLQMSAVNRRMMAERIEAALRRLSQPITNDQQYQDIADEISGSRGARYHAGTTYRQ